MNIVFLVPTGIGAEIGGHAGDANPALNLIGSLSDNIITHPNVVNASDINEMPENCWYTCGAMLDKFLSGEISIKRPYLNRILLLAQTINTSLLNTVNAARATMGLSIELVKISSPLVLEGFINPRGLADGNISGWEDLICQVEDSNIDFDALAISSHIDVNEKHALKYMRGETTVNPWGFVEAKLSKLVFDALGKPLAHAPFGDTLVSFNETVDARKSAEMISECYLLSVLKGLRSAPRKMEPLDYSRKDVGRLLNVMDIDLMISPVGCFGDAHESCLKHKIQILYVKENAVYDEEFLRKVSGDFCENYLEAAGYVSALKKGLSIESLRRPLSTLTQVSAA